MCFPVVLLNNFGRKISSAWRFPKSYFENNNNNNKNKKKSQQPPPLPANDEKPESFSGFLIGGDAVVSKGKGSGEGKLLRPSLQKDGKTLGVFACGLLLKKKINNNKYGPKIHVGILKMVQRWPNDQG